MKFYFTTATSCFLADFTDPTHEPEYVAAFDLKKGQSTFTPRYALENGKLVDKYPDKTDEEVAAEIKAAEDAKAATLAAQNAPA